MAKAGEYHPLAAEAAGASYSPYKLTIKDLVYCFIASIAMSVIAMAVSWPAVDYCPAPQMFIRLVEFQGLDPCVREVRSPLFELAVEVDRVSKSESKRWPCARGGEDAMLRVSYHGVILAWGSVPRFCIDDASLQGPSVVATAEGSVLRKELRNMIRAEIDALGSAEFDVEGNLPGLGHVRCKTYLFQGEPREQLPPCRIAAFRKMTRQDS